MTESKPTPARAGAAALARLHLTVWLMGVVQALVKERTDVLSAWFGLLALMRHTHYAAKSVVSGQWSGPRDPLPSPYL